MAQDYQDLWTHVTNTADEAQAAQILAKILADKEGRDFISRLDKKNVESCIEILDNGVAKRNLEPTDKRPFFITLRRLTERHKLLPDRVKIKGSIEVLDKLLGSGGLADVKSGTYEGRSVAVRIMRISVKDDFARKRKEFCKEVILWSALSHPNVLRLVGVQEDIYKRQLITVSEWMSHGNIMEYIRENHANRLDLLHGAAQGLMYLHSINLAHGDLKGSNILVSNDTPPRACLADFDFTTTVPNPGQNLSSSAQTDGGTHQFKSPERLVPEVFGKKDALPTQQADIYAFGMVIFQVLTGESPFHGVRIPALGYFVLRGERPTKPENASAIGFSDSLWDFTQRCWDGKIELRPTAGEVVAHLGEAVAGWDGLMPPCPQIEYAASGPEETSGSKYSRIFQPASNPTESQTVSGILPLSNTVFAQPIGPPQKGSQEVVARLFGESQPQSCAPPRSEEPHDSLYAAKLLPHLNQCHNPPRHNPPRRASGPACGRSSGSLVSGADPPSLVPTIPSLA